jgi:hypothetical protein
VTAGLSKVFRARPRPRPGGVRTISNAAKFPVNTLC